MLRTNTTSQATFSRPGSVTFVMPQPPSNVVTIHVPPGSSWTTGLHWHETHTELLQVVKGKAHFTINGFTQTHEAGDTPVRIEKLEMHEWGRASIEDDHEDLIVQEWTDPADEQKEIFFRNLNSIILDGNRTTPKWVPAAWWVEWQIKVISNGLDDFPVLVQVPLLAQVISRGILTLTSIAGQLMGLKPYYTEYTPTEISPKAKKDI